MNIFIKLIDNTKYKLDVNLEITISKLKDEIQEKLNINKCKQRLIFNGNYLSDCYNLEKYGIVEDSVIFLVYQMY